MKVEGAIEHIAERECAYVRSRDGDRHRKAEAAMQAGENRQINAEGEAIDDAEAEKRWCNDRRKPERKPIDDGLTPVMEPVDQA